MTVARFSSDAGTFAREARLTELTARYFWRALRPLAKRHLSRRCQRCVLPETYAAIDSDGLCEHCLSDAGGPAVAASSADATAAVNQLLQAHQAGSSRYDAIVLVSGGKDSAYLLHELTRQFSGLRLLTVLVDNGFMSPFALQNATAVVERFDTAHVTLRPKPSFVRKAFHHALTHLELQTGYSIVDQMDGWITFDAARNLAAELSIPLVIAGLSRVQVQTIFGDIGFEFPDELTQGPPSSYAGITLTDVFSADEMKNWWDGTRWPKERVPRFIMPLCAWNPDETHILREVERLELIDPRRSSPLLTNNRLIPVIGMAEVARFGYSCFELEFATMVRQGKSERDYWLNLFEMLEYSTKTGRFVNRTVEETLARLGLSKADLGISGGH